MERELFDWEEYDQYEGAAFQFENCRLKKDIGSRKEGEVIPFISVDIDNGTMRFMEESGEETEAFKIRLEVVGPLETNPGARNENQEEDE